MHRLALSLVFLCFAGVGSTHAQAAPPAATQSGWIRGEKIHIDGVPNAGKVSEQLYRGAQPHIASMALLKEMGITTVVDLRAEDAVMREREAKEAGRLGIHFVSIPVGGWANPTNEQIAQFLALFERDPRERVFVHCHYGEDRAGLFVATYRMAIQKWTAEQALGEMYEFGFHGLWHPHMASFVRKFPARLTSVPALAKVSSPAPSVSTIISPN